MNQYSRLLVSTLSAFVFIHCSSGLYGGVNEDPVLYTQVNLRHNTAFGISTKNYLDHDTLDICTKVKIERIHGKRLSFTAVDTGVRFHFNIEEDIVDPRRYFQRFFKESCPENEIMKLSKIDQEGIKNSNIVKGMSKKGIYHAIGLPPRIITPNLKLDVWRYYKNQLKAVEIEFEEDKVVRIQTIELYNLGIM